MYLLIHEDEPWEKTALWAVCGHQVKPRVGPKHRAIEAKSRRYPASHRGDGMIAWANSQT